MTKILIADHQPSFRRGVREHLLEGLPGVSVEEASNGEEMLHYLKGTKFNLVTMDITMPGWSLLQVTQTIREICQSTHILVLTMHPEDEYGPRMLHAGADGYLSKSACCSDLIMAVKKILMGGMYISGTLAESLVMDIKPQNEDAAIHKRLTNREYEVFNLIAMGRSVGQIAKILNLSVATISTYRTHILEKLSLETNADIVCYAYELGLRQPSCKRREVYKAGEDP
jgi:two-component system, NarL family, invasion response regulator UvrY